MHAYAIELSKELGIKPEQVDRTLALSAEGATVPFIARYRKEVTGGLDEVQIQAILDGAAAREELDARRETILRSIESQGKLTPELSRALERARTRAELEDLYLPYKPKRRTRAAIARERGLEPLADLLWKQEGARGEDVKARVRPFVNADKDVPDLDTALAGARDICAERVAEEAGVLWERWSGPSADEVADRVVAMATGREITASDGSPVVVEAASICVHGDTPGAVDLARRVRSALVASGVSLAPFVPAGER